MIWLLYCGIVFVRLLCFLLWFGLICVGLFGLARWLWCVACVCLVWFDCCADYCLGLGVGVMFCGLVVDGLGSLLWCCLVVRFWLRGLLGCLVVGFACGGS